MEMRNLRRIESMTRMDRILNEDIRRLGVEAVLAVADRKNEWRERIEEMPQQRLLRSVFKEDVCTRRPRGTVKKEVDRQYIMTFLVV